jgi:hypothetical protein
MGQFVADILIRQVLVHLLEGYEMSLEKSAGLEEWERNGEVWINHPDLWIRCVKR